MYNVKNERIMKTIKYLVMGVLLAGFSTTAMAQEAELNAALQAIKNNAADKADVVKTAQKKNKSRSYRTCFLRGSGYGTGPYVCQSGRRGIEAQVCSRLHPSG